MITAEIRSNISFLKLSEDEREVYFKGQSLGIAYKGWYRIGGWQWSLKETHGKGLTELAIARVKFLQLQSRTS